MPRLFNKPIDAWESKGGILEKAFGIAAWEAGFDGRYAIEKWLEANGGIDASDIISSVGKILSKNGYAITKS